MSIIKVEKLLEEYPSYVTIEDTKKIIEQLESCICQIYANDGGKGTGFFCIIKSKDSNEKIPVLFTNNHILNENDIKTNQIIKISFYGKNSLIYKDIKIGEDRFVYTNQIYDTTIIEIKNEKDDIKNFLEIDQRIFQENSNVIYYGNSVYLLHYPGNKSASVSYGIVRNNEQINHKIIHCCSTEGGSSGGPILSLSHMKVFGIHRGAGKKFNGGTFLKYPIEDFLLRWKKNKDIGLQNQIILELKVNKEDINYPVYFLDNVEDENHFHSYLKELNETNAKIFNNGKEHKYQKFFKPKKEGIYKLKLQFDIIMKDCSYMFANCKSLIFIDLSLFNTKHVKNMSYMFYGCSKLTFIDLSSFDTSEVTDMSHMFHECSNLSLIDLTTFNTSKVRDMTFMFGKCENLNSINLSLFDTHNVEYMTYMFAYCKNLTFIDLTMFDYSNVINKSFMFSHCLNLKEIKVRKEFYTEIENLINNKNAQKSKYYLTNSIRYEFNPSELFSQRLITLIQKHLEPCLFADGYQIFSLIENTLYGVMEGPISTPYQNGFFLFKIIIDSDFPMVPPKFYFITKIFHPNISGDGLVSADFLENKWRPALKIDSIIISVQSILGEPNFDVFLNAEAVSLYKLSKKVYNDTIIEYINQYANYSIFKNHVKELKGKDLINICDN